MRIGEQERAGPHEPEDSEQGPRAHRATALVGARAVRRGALPADNIRAAIYTLHGSCAEFLCTSLFRLEFAYPGSSLLGSTGTSLGRSGLTLFSACSWCCLTQSCATHFSLSRPTPFFCLRKWNARAPAAAPLYFFGFSFPRRG